MTFHPPNDAKVYDYRDVQVIAHLAAIKAQADMARDALREMEGLARQATAFLQETDPLVGELRLFANLQMAKRQKLYADLGRITTVTEEVVERPHRLHNLAKAAASQDWPTRREPHDSMNATELAEAQAHDERALNDPTVDCCGRDAANCDCPSEPFRSDQL